MRVKKGFKTENIAGETFIIATGEMAESFKNTIVLNDTSLFIFNSLQVDTTIDKIAKKIVEIYDIDLLTAKNDIIKVVECFKQYDILEGN